MAEVSTGASIADKTSTIDIRIRPFRLAAKGRWNQITNPNAMIIYILQSTCNNPSGISAMRESSETQRQSVGKRFSGAACQGTTKFSEKGAPLISDCKADG